MKWWLVVLTLVLAFAVRFYQINQIPASLYFDEIDNGYQARSLIETGRDYRGGWSPFYVHSVNDIRPPLSTYFVVLSTLVFKDPYLQVKMAQIICGVLSVLLIILIINLWTSNFRMACLIGVIFALNPWQIQFSRSSQEMIIMQLTYLVGLYFFSKGIINQKLKFLIIGVISISLAIFSYRTMSFFVPLTFVVLGMIFYQDLMKFGLKKLSLILIIISVIILPFLIFTTLYAPDLPRINQLSITSSPAIPISIQRDREVDSGDLENSPIGKSAVWYSYIFHNKPLSWLGVFFNNYFQTFSTEYLFLKGDPNLRHSTSMNGVLLSLDIIGLIFGIVYLARNLNNKFFKFLTIWLITAPIAAAITFDGAKHGARLFIFSAPLLILVGLGWNEVIYNLKFNIFKKDFKPVVIVGLILIWITQFTIYYHGYLTHYRINSARWFGYGYQQAMTKISQVENDYQKVYLTSTIDPPMIYYLFWSNTPPIYLQEYGTNFSQDRILGKRLDKYKPLDDSFQINKESDLEKVLQPKSLYLLSDNELPKSIRDNILKIKTIKVLQIVRYPDQQTAFYLITRG